MAKWVRNFDVKNREIVLNAARDFSGSLNLDGKRYRITIEPMSRSLEQNAKLHAMLADIAAQKSFNGKKMNVQQWKTLFVSGHAVATNNQPELVQGLENELVNLRESTASMGVARCASLIEYISAWAAENGVRFRAIGFDE